MTEFGIVSIISLIGFLILAVSALRAHQLSMKRGLVLVLSWAAIFAVVILFIDLIT